MQHFSMAPTLWQPIDMLLPHWASGLSPTNKTRHPEYCHFRFVFCDRVVPPAHCDRASPFMLKSE